MTDIKEKVARALQHCDQQDGHQPCLWENLDKFNRRNYLDKADSVLQCLSDNIDEDGIIEASKAYCAANDYDRFNEVLDRKEPAWTDYTKEITTAIQAYLNTISKK